MAVYPHVRFIRYFSLPILKCGAARENKSQGCPNRSWRRVLPQPGIGTTIDGKGGTPCVEIFPGRRPLTWQPAKTRETLIHVGSPNTNSHRVQFEIFACISMEFVKVCIKGGAGKNAANAVFGFIVEEIVHSRHIIGFEHLRGECRGAGLHVSLPDRLQPILD